MPVISRSKALRHQTVSFATRTTKRCSSGRQRRFMGISEVARSAIQSTADASSTPSRWTTPHCRESVFDKWGIPAMKNSTRARASLDTSTPVARPLANHGSTVRSVMQRRIHTVANSDRAAPPATTRSAGQSRHFDILRHAPGIVLSAITARRVIERRTSVRCAPKLLTSRTPRSTSAIPATNRRHGMTSRVSAGTRATRAVSSAP